MLSRFCNGVAQNVEAFVTPIADRLKHALDRVRMRRKLTGYIDCLSVWQRIGNFSRLSVDQSLFSRQAASYASPVLRPSEVGLCLAMLSQDLRIC